MGADDDEIRAEVSVGPVEFKEPDVIGVGGGRCKCGAFRWTNVTASAGISFQSQPSCCGSVIEVLPGER